MRTEHIYVIRSCIRIKGEVSSELNWFKPNRSFFLLVDPFLLLVPREGCVSGRLWHFLDIFNYITRVSQ